MLILLVVSILLNFSLILVVRGLGNDKIRLEQEARSMEDRLNHNNLELRACKGANLVLQNRVENLNKENAELVTAEMQRGIEAAMGTYKIEVIDDSVVVPKKKTKKKPKSKKKVKK